MNVREKLVYTIVMVLCISISGIVNAEESKKDQAPVTLFTGSGDVSFSGYGALYSSYTRIKGNNAALAGIRGGLIIDNNWVVGLAGLGLVHPYERDDFTNRSYTGEDKYVQFGYGGVLFEYHFMPKELIHFSVGTLLGGGGFCYSSNDDSRDDRECGDNFFIVEPEVYGFINLARFCRVGIGGSYRYTYGLDSEDLEDSDARGFSVSVMAAFGWF